MRFWEWVEKNGRCSGMNLFETKQGERIKELETMLLFLVENDSINDGSIDKEVIELLNK